MDHPSLQLSHLTHDLGGVDYHSHSTLNALLSLFLRSLLIEINTVPESLDILSQIHQRQVMMESSVSMHLFPRAYAASQDRLTRQMSDVLLKKMHS